MTPEEQAAATHGPAPTGLQSDVAQAKSVISPGDMEQLHARRKAYAEIAQNQQAHPADRQEALKRYQFTSNLVASQHSWNPEEPEPGMDTFGRNYASAGTFGLSGLAGRALNRTAGITPQEQQHLDRGDAANDQANPGSAFAGGLAGSFIGPGMAYSAMRAPAARLIASQIGPEAGAALRLGAGAAREVIPGAFAAGTTGALEGATQPAPDMRERFYNASRGARAALSEPSTYLMPAGAGLLGESLQGAGRAVMGSKGGRARQLIEREGQGAKVGLLSPGSGGVFDKELADISPRQTGGETKAILSTARKEQQEGWTQPYQPNYEQLKADAQAKARPVAEERLKKIEELFSRQAGKGAQLKRTADEVSANMPADNDVTGIVNYLKETAKRPAAHEAWPKLNQAIDVLEGYRQQPTAPSGLVDASGNPLGAPPAPGKVLVTPEILNEVRGMLSGMGKLGQSDAMVGKNFPLSKAAAQARAMVQNGPYQPGNEAFAEAYKGRAEGRKAAGLPEDLPRRREADLRRLSGEAYREEYSKTRKTAEAQQSQGEAAYRERADAAKVREQELVALQAARRALSPGLGPFHSVAPHSLVMANIPPITGRALYPAAKAAVGGQPGKAAGRSLLLGAREAQRLQNERRAQLVAGGQ